MAETPPITINAHVDTSSEIILKKESPPVQINPTTSNSHPQALSDSLKPKRTVCPTAYTVMAMQMCTAPIINASSICLS